MTRGLIEKELRQHGLALGFLLVLPFAGLILILSHGLVRRAGGGGFEAVRLLLMLFIPLACLVLGQLLIASEYRHKTQLFLEGLPLPRTRMLAVKFGLGLILVTLMSVVALGYVGWIARGTEAMTPRFAALLGLKSAGWGAFIYTLCFAHAFLGRYRLPFGLALVVGLISLSNAGMPVSEFGPFALIDSRFPFERFVWPVQALLVTAALVVALAALGFFLGLVRDATVASMLAEKMSPREKLVLTMLVFVGLLASGWFIERRKTFTPVQMPGAAEARHGVVQVLASAAVDAPTREETTILQSTANHVATELGALADYLGCDTFPPVFIVHRRDLGTDDLVDGELKMEQGVLVKANLTDPHFNQLALDEWLVYTTLFAHTHGIAGRERNAWVLDGITWWWPRSQHGRVSAWDAASGQSWTPADIARFNPAQMHSGWFTIRKKMNTKNARAFAGSSLAFLAEHHGADGVHRFLGDRFAQAQPVDVRGWWRDFIRPTATRLRAATGLSEDVFTAEFRAAAAAPHP